jgi:hypothetical protein
VGRDVRDVRVGDRVLVPLYAFSWRGRIVLRVEGLFPLGVIHRDRVLRIALEHRELLDLAGNGLDDLDAGRGGPDDPDALAPAINVPGLPRGVEDPALELVLCGEPYHRRR